MTNNLFEKLQELAKELKNAQKEGESQMETALREIKENISFSKKLDEARNEISPKQAQEFSQIVDNFSQPEIKKNNEVTPVTDQFSPPQAPQTPAVQPQYRFKDGDLMNSEMTTVFSANWQSLYNRRVLSSLYGITPHEQGVQNELHRVYTSVPKQEFGYIRKENTMIPVSALMIEPIK